LPDLRAPDGRPFTYAEIKETRMDDRLESRRPMTLFTINTATGATKSVLHTTDWLGHVQFSPTDPGLLMFCHEGPWHKVDRIWTVRTDTTTPAPRLLHVRTMNMEIAGHEFFAPDGKTIWYDLQLPRGEDFFVAGVDLASGARTWWHLQRDEWSVHFMVSPDGTLFAGDGGDSEMVAHAKDGKWLYLFRPQTIPDVAGIKAPNSGTLIRPGYFQAERLVDLSKHDYRLEPNIHFTPDQKWLIFRSNMHGPMHVYAVEIAKAK
jgi:oligogalacturonide lyase